MIPITVALPPKIRGAVYLIYGLLGLVIGAIQVGYLATSYAQPVWLTVALVVVPFLGAGMGLTAASNTQTSPEPVTASPYAKGGLITSDEEPIRVIEGEHLWTSKKDSL